MVNKEQKIYDEGFQKGKLEQKKEELIFLQNMKIALMIFGDLEIEGMEDGQVMVLRRIKQLQKEIGGMK